MTALAYLGLLTLGLTGYGLYESFSHRRNLSKIRNRIHVSGTRGKSSVTRLLAAGLLNNNIKTAAKTTGTLARMLLPDGREIPLFRPSGANILEQKRVMEAAAALKLDALVIECMALQPELHWISENRFVRATHGVITNVRPDHLDVMGPTPENVAQAISGMIPVNGKLYTAEQKYLDILRYAADDRNTELVAITAEDSALVTPEELAGFSYTEHPENVALVLRVLSDFGINRKDGLRGMWQVTPDPGVLTEHHLEFFGRHITFVNAFAANDPQSTATIWQMMKKKYPDIENKVIVFNLRDDRASRTQQMALESTFWHEAGRVVLMGTGAYLFSRLAAKTGYPMNRFAFADNSRVEDIFEIILENSGKSALVVGMGNIGGLGLPLVRYFKNREILEETTNV